MKNKIILILTTAVIMPFCLTFAQDVEGRLMTLNEALNPAYILTMKRSDIEIQGFRENKHVKTDEVNVYDLDLESLKFSTVENAVTVKCFEDIDGCIMRVLVRERKKKSYRNRLVFSVPDGKTGEEVAEKLRLFLMDLSKKN